MTNKEAEEVLAARYGATGEDDPARGGGCKKYQLNGWHLWLCRRGWAKAQLIDNHYCNHSYHPDLEEAFKACGGKTMQHITRDRPLTPEEVATYNKIRAQVAEEFPPSDPSDDEG